MSVPAQIAALLDGRLDVGFVRPPIGDAALNSEIVISEPLVVALPPKHRFASRSHLQLSGLANEPFVLPSRDAVPMFHAAVLRACREAGFVPHAPHEVDHLHMVLRMVAAGAGVALVPGSARKINQGRVAYRALRPSSGNSGNGHGVATRRHVRDGGRIHQRGATTAASSARVDR
jgi:DNA-binding transcriptional LysR family regulator